MDVLQKQYALTQSSRELVFNFIQTKVGDDLNRPVSAYDNKTIGYLLGHTARCYFDWLSYFALQQPSGSLNDQGFTTVPLIRHLYRQVDDLVIAFLENFKEKMEVPINGKLPDNWPASATPLQLFTQVLTHEFHHKGQIMLMCRILGYTPPETDTSLAFPTW